MALYFIMTSDQDKNLPADILSLNSAGGELYVYFEKASPFIKLKSFQ
jgi:hypothetical protein